MSKDKRSVSTDALETLGTIIDENAGRDAIHLAVEPIEAGEYLDPGDHVGIVNGVATKNTKKKLGIVDPFLKNFVSTGERFWLVVYPRQITSLRHVWSHPEFPEKENLVNESAMYKMMEEKLKSEEWLKNFAVFKDIEYDELMYAAQQFLDGGHYLTKGAEFEGERTPDEFWDHYENVTGKPISENDRGNFFSCSC